MAKKKIKPMPPVWNMSTGDCIKMMRGIVVDVDLAFADPPFNIDWPGYEDYDDNRAPQEYIRWCSDWFYQIHRVLNDYGTFWLAIGDEYVSELDVMAKKAGFHRQSWVVWYFTFGVACPRNFARSHTHLLRYTKHKTKFTFNQDDKKLRVPSARQLVYKDSRANPKGKLPDNTWVLSPLDLEHAFSPAEDTWLVSRVCGTFKEREQRGEYQKTKTVPQMPVEILNRIVVSCSNPGDLVIDPFGGTFTTGEAAVANGRDFWGCDISKEYVAQGRHRVKKALDRYTSAKD